MMDDSSDLDFRKALIKRQVCFFELTSEEIEELAGLFAKVSVTTGETIVTKGDLVDSIYLIATGTANVKLNKSRVTLGPGEAIGLNETGFYSLSGKRTATVVANEPMVLWRLDVAEFHGFSLSHPHVSSVMRDNASSFSRTK